MEKNMPTSAEVDYYLYAVDMILGSAPRRCNPELMTLIIFKLVEAYKMENAWANISMMVSSFLQKNTTEEVTESFLVAKTDADDFLAMFNTNKT